MSNLAELIGRPESTMAVTFTEPLGMLAIQSISWLDPVAEFRADLYPDHDSDYLIRHIAKLSSMPVLLTVRHELEAGNWRGTETERFELFGKLLPEVAGVDIELAAEILPKVLDLAHDQDKTVVVSTHDFISTPSLDRLEDYLGKSQERGADYTKIATRADTLEEYRRLAGFTIKHADDNLIVVAMGNYGRQSRTVFPSLGSCLTYASAGDNAVAPGQLTYQETHKGLMEFDPSYAALFA